MRLVAVACGLRCSAARGIFQHQGLNLCPLYQVGGFLSTLKSGSYILQSALIPGFKNYSWVPFSAFSINLLPHVVLVQMY